MINVICVVRRPLRIRSASQCTRRSLAPTLRWITGITLFHFNSESKFLLINESNFHASDVAAASASRWILATTTFKWIPAATTSSRPSRPEFQHLSPTFQLRILATTIVGTSSWRASPAVGNASVDDTDAAAAAAAIFFFTTDGKSFVHTFNCSIHNTSKC
jgi:hypothetical protein